MARPCRLRSGCADVALAILTLHHWDDWAAGLAELCRVAPRRIVLTMDFELHSRFWFLEDYVPEVGEATRAWSPGTTPWRRSIGARRCGDVHVIPLLVPRDMQDGVLGAYWCRPEAYLDPAVRANCSGLALADPAVVARGVAALEADLSQRGVAAASCRPGRVGGDRPRVPVSSSPTWAEGGSRAGTA